MKLYSELVPWYRLLDPLDGHREEAALYAKALKRVVQGGSLLELGSGAGNTAHFLRDDFDCTLTDLSPDMLELSRGINPDCVHVQGDMRTLRLGRTFDAVLVHDAVCYMTTPGDLRAALATVAAHLRPGGAAIIAPDHFRDTFDGEYTEVDEADHEGLSLRSLAWVWDPDPDDCTYQVDYAFLVRRNGLVQAVHETHHEGLFSLAQWRAWMADAGLEPIETLSRPVENGDNDRVFLVRQGGPPTEA